MENTYIENFESNFWEDTSEELLHWLLQDGVPICTIFEDLPPGIHLCQIRYKSNKGKLKTRWLEDKRPKSASQDVFFGVWTLRPEGIKLRKQSICPSDFSFCFHMDKMLTYDKESDFFQYVAKIETSLDGRLLRRTIVEEEGDNTFPVRFAFPKRIVSKINHVLMENFLYKLWRGPRYAAWHRVPDGISVYMGMINYRGQEYHDKLSALLRSDIGDVALVLLAYTCFSILKPFFPQYHELDATTPYIKAKRYLPEHLAINVRSDPPELAARLADLCCRWFQANKHDRIPIIDGVVIQKTPQKPTALGINEYEAKVLQPACVLWVNRIPAKELTESGRIIDLQLPAGAVGIDVEPFVADMVASLTQKICEISRASIQSLETAILESSISPISEFRKNILITAEKYTFSLDADILEELEMPLLELRSIVALGPVDYIKYLYQQITCDIENDIDDVLPEYVTQYRELQDELFIIYSKCKRNVRKGIRKSRNKKFSLDPYYENRRAVLTNEMQADEDVVKKFAYLFASIDIFFQYCSTEKVDVNRIKSVLAMAWNQQRRSWCATAVLEAYVIKMIQDGHCARVRGQGSDRPDVYIWYDPREKQFLLPSRTYYSALGSADPSVTKRVFEKKLEDEGTLCTCQRNKQIRRTFEIKLSPNTLKTAVLKVSMEKFSKKFFESIKVQRQLRLMETDASSFQSGSTIV